MSQTTLAVLLEDLIEVLMNVVDDEDQRQEIYDGMMQPFEAAGMEDFSVACGFDTAFDRVYMDHYPELETETNLLLDNG